MILGFEMIKAIIPIYIKNNSFWSSSKGLDLIDIFIKKLKKVKEIESIVVLSEDNAVKILASKYDLAILDEISIDTIDQPYKISNLKEIGKKYCHICKEFDNTLLILDHRNLLLKASDIQRAIKLHKENVDDCIVSLAFCHDYPCQSKTFYNFLDCSIIDFDTSLAISGYQKSFLLTVPHNKKNDETGQHTLTVSVSKNAGDFKFLFTKSEKSCDEVVAQIIPLGADGPCFDQFTECYISLDYNEVLIKTIDVNLCGVIVVLLSPSHNGEYDCVELFTPLNAPWELYGKGSTVMNKITHEPMLGRQKFPDAYSFDGSLCLIGNGGVDIFDNKSIVPLLLADSCIVTGEIEYLYTSVDK